MRLELLTPWAAAVAIAAAAPVAAWLAADRRAARLRRAVRLPPPSRARRLGVPAAAALVVAALAAAAAQPVLTSRRETSVRTSAEVFVVIDTSRSMSAGAPSRIARAIAAARTLRMSLPDVPVGIASMTDRVLPHLFPTGDVRVFDAAVLGTVAVDSPPPVTLNEGRATFLGSLGALATGRFFSPSSRSRVAVVVTDGETRAVDAPALDRTLAAARIRLVFLHVWRAGDRIRRECIYRADPAAPAELARLARLLRAPVSSQPGEAARAVRSRLGRGGARVERVLTTKRPLAPWAVLAAVPSLGFLLARRNVRLTKPK